MLRMPGGKRFFKRCFCAVLEVQNQRAQLARRNAFRIAGEVAVDDLHLVEVAHLHRYTGQQLRKTFASVARNTLYDSAFFLYFDNRGKVKRIAFTAHFADKKRLFADGVQQHHHAVIAPEIGGIQDEIDGFGCWKC